MENCPNSATGKIAPVPQIAPVPSRASTYHKYRACIQMILVKFWDKVLEI